MADRDRMHIADETDREDLEGAADEQFEDAEDAEDTENDDFDEDEVGSDTDVRNQSGPSDRGTRGSEDMTRSTGGDDYVSIDRPSER